MPALVSASRLVDMVSIATEADFELDETLTADAPGFGDGNGIDTTT